MSHELTTRKWALCQNGCGVVDQATLIPDDNDPPGLCPTCKGQTCDCDSCLRAAIEEIWGASECDVLLVVLNILMERKSAKATS